MEFCYHWLQNQRTKKKKHSRIMGAMEFALASKEKERVDGQIHSSLLCLSVGSANPRQGRWKDQNSDKVQLDEI